MTSSERQLELLKEEHQAGCLAVRLAKMGRKGMDRNILMEECVGSRVQDQKGC